MSIRQQKVWKDVYTFICLPSYWRHQWLNQPESLMTGIWNKTLCTPYCTFCKIVFSVNLLKRIFRYSQYLKGSLSWSLNRESDTLRLISCMLVFDKKCPFRETYLLDEYLSNSNYTNRHQIKLYDEHKRNVQLMNQKSCTYLFVKTS